MGVSDGFVVGSTPLLFGSAADTRWHMLLLAEGYQQEELPGFALQAQQFVEQLVATPPFDAIDVESALAIARIDVSSTDSGADDPVACGGTGDAPNTYFDATFCQNNIPRLMAADMDLALSVVQSLVSEWHTIVVVVNSSEYGGAGYVEGAVVSTHGQWVQRCLHELGHTAFGLADEYEYEEDCTSGEKGHDVFTGPEPPEPNVTKAAKAPKWLSLTTPGVTLPTSTNPDCAKCDSQKNPVAPDTVGAFEGAGHFHCGLFRPQFTCLMRDTNHVPPRPFCAVCQHRIRSVLAPYTAYVATPSDAAVDVDPWPATLKWRAGAFESAWQVQVSTAADFSVGEGPVHVVDSVVENGERFGLQKLQLRPATEYFWRVRKNSAGAEASWTASRRFTTADKPCVPKSPSIEEQKLYHPWALPFSWSAVDGAISYQIEVFESQDCLGSKPIIQKAGDLTATASIDVKVDQAHWWRIRAAGRDNFGPWSACVPFQTNKPKVQLTSPADGSAPYPWGLTLQWKKVTGAAYYTVERTRSPEGFSPDAPIESVTVLHPKHQTTIDLDPQLTVLQEKHSWHVGVTGPDLHLAGSNQAPFQQDGTTSDPWTVVNDGDATVPAVEAPAHWSAAEPPYVPYLADVPFQWQHVHLAEKYELSLYPFKAVGKGGYEVDWHNPTYVAPFDRDANPDGQTVTLAGEDASAPPHGGQVYGYLFSVRAIGPQGRKSPIDPGKAPSQQIPPHTIHAHAGPHRGDGLYYIQAPPLTADGGQLIPSDDGRVYWNGSWDDRYLLLGAQQNPKWSPSGKYEIQLFDGLGCGSFLYWSTDNDIVAQTWVYAQANQEGSYRMRAHGDYGAFHLNEKKGGWSNCLGFTLVSKAAQKRKDNPPDPPPQGIPTASCGEKTYAGGNAPEEFIVMLNGKQEGTIGIQGYNYCVPDLVIIEHDYQSIWDSTCISYDYSKSVPFSGKNDWIKIRVEPKCVTDLEPDCPDPEVTAWWFVVFCP